MSWIQDRIYKKLTSKDLSRNSYFFYRWLADKYQDKEKYEIALNRLTQYVYSINDIHIGSSMQKSFNDMFVLNDIVVIISDDVDVWFGPSGVGMQQLVDTTKLRIHLIPDRWTTRQGMQEQFILNRSF